jgi:D-tyrosyl-tRNA(Tyr) deacylase
MRAVLQRVAKAKVTVDNKTVGEIGRGVMLLVGMDTGDDISDYKYILDKSVKLRIFEDENDKMNLSAEDLGLGLLIVPNFTIYADARHGRRPSFAMGAKPEEARKTFEEFVNYAKSEFPTVESGIFQADMQVELVNDGPITILLDSDKMF